MSRYYVAVNTEFGRVHLPCNTSEERDRLSLLVAKTLAVSGDMA